MGMGVVGLGVLGLSLLYIFTAAKAGRLKTISVLTGFSFGASSIALFACGWWHLHQSG